MLALLRLGLSQVGRKVAAGAFWRPAARLGVLALAIAGAGCEGEGTGQVSGTLFVRACQALDPTTPGSSDVPSPLPSYAMNPTYFFAELELAARYSPADDPPGVNRLRLRLQTSSHKIERTDAFELFIYDLDGLATRQASAMAHGLSGMPIVPPPLDVTPIPARPDPASTVRASLVLNGSCTYPLVAPLLSGFVHFSQIGSQPGDILAGEFAVTVEDLRAQREQGAPAPSPDVAGALSGTFSFPIRTGPAAGAI